MPECSSPKRSVLSNETGKWGYSEILSLDESKKVVVFGVTPGTKDHETILSHFYTLG